MGGWSTWLGIGLLGGAGAMLRYVVSSACVQRFGSLPLGTLVVNVIGCFLLGLIALSPMGEELPESLRRGIAIGFLGAFTTYSTFGVETFAMLEEGRTFAALTNLAAHTFLGLGAVWLAVAAGRAFTT